ncbi:HAD-like domain-containing protein [Obelidium mucronatum]|nr:HAD-like domain-containing protein [Obelidium mucronatum]
MSKFELLALDVDGTLITTDQQITPRTVAIIQKIYAKGSVKIALVTGRPDFNTDRVEKTLGVPVYVIGYNGSVGRSLNKSDRPVFAETMSEEQVLQIAKVGTELDLTVCVYQYGKDYIQRIGGNSDGHNALVDRFREESCTELEPAFIVPTTDVPKVFLLTSEPEKHLQIVRKAAPGVNVYLERYFLDCVPATVDKGKGLRLLCKEIGIPLEKVVAFGDGTNDGEFLKTACVGVAMANAVQELKDVADRVTKYTNNQDGLAIELEEMEERGDFGL